MVFGRETRWFGAWTAESRGVRPDETSWQEAILARAKQLQQLRDCVYPRALDRLERKSEASRELQDRRNKVVPKPLKQGQMVYTKAEFPPHHKPKLEEEWLGPFKIVDQVPGGQYRLANSDGELLDRTVPLQKLRLGKEMAKASSVWQVDRIVDHEATETGRRFLVRWAGYSDDKDSWVNEDDFVDGGKSVDEYFEHLGEHDRKRYRRTESDDDADAAMP